MSKALPGEDSEDSEDEEAEEDNEDLESEEEDSAHDFIGGTFTETTSTLATVYLSATDGSPDDQGLTLAPASEEVVASVLIDLHNSGHLDLTSPFEENTDEHNEVRTLLTVLAALDVNRCVQKNVATSELVNEAAAVTLATSELVDGAAAVTLAMQTESQLSTVRNKSRMIANH